MMQEHEDTHDLLRMTNHGVHMWQSHARKNVTNWESDEIQAPVKSEIILANGRTKRQEKAFIVQCAGFSLFFLFPFSFFLGGGFGLIWF